MKTLKKHIKIYMINQEIHHLNRELVSESDIHLRYMGQLQSPYKSGGGFTRPSEKHEIIRQQINKLAEKRDALRKS